MSKKKLNIKKIKFFAVLSIKPQSFVAFFIAKMPIFLEDKRIHFLIYLKMDKMFETMLNR